MSDKFLFRPLEDGDLRDPTREELYTGPKRETLPLEIQQLSSEDTACTFCGVSYFVFAEVQELQGIVKKYKKTFHEFVRFLEREQRVSQDLKAQVAAIKQQFDDVTKTCSISIQQLSQQTLQLRVASSEDAKRRMNAEKELALATEAKEKLQAQMKHQEQEWRSASMLTEQKMRNEILHLSSQLEKCKLLSSTQEDERKAEFERERAKMRELEVHLADKEAEWKASERLVVTERDQLKQKLLEMTERVQMEQETAKQFEAQLTAVRLELQRVVGANDAERVMFSQLNSDVILLKHQINGLERNKALLLSERAQQQEELAKADSTIQQLRTQVNEVQIKLQENVTTREKIKHDYAKELEKLRQDHSNEINRLQRDHAKHIDSLKTSQSEYIEYLKKITLDVQAGVESSNQTTAALEKQLREAEQLVTKWKDQAQRSMDELQHVRMSSLEAQSLQESLERKITRLERDNKELEQQRKSLQQDLDHHIAKAQQYTEKLQQDLLEQCRQNEDQRLTLQKHVDALETKLVSMKEENARLSTTARSITSPQVAWQDAPTTSGKPLPNNNQESHDNEKVVERLRHTLKQKDHVGASAASEEISLLQQTVHRECMERTSLLEKMRSGKIAPDLGPQIHISTRELSLSAAADTTLHAEDDDECRDNGVEGNDSQPKAASFYEKLRRAGHRKSKTKK